MKKKLLAMLVAGTMTAGLAAGPAQVALADSKDQIELVTMIENPEVPVTKEIVKKMEEKFPEVKFVNKKWDQSQVEKSVKTAFAAGEAIDIVQYWPNQMKNFTSSDMALDLTPYLDADEEWKNSWVESTLEVGNFDGKYVSVPFGTVYPLLQVNADILEEAGVEIKSQWTWEEFTDACKAIKEKTGKFPLGVKAENACWFIRNGLMQVWENQEELDSFNAGEISFTDERVKKVFDDVKALYDENYLYPGEGAVSATQDQVLAAFGAGEIAMFCNVNNQCGLAKEAADGAFDIQLISWPNMGSPEMDYLLGGSDGFFIPANSQNADKAVEVLKYLTSPEILQMYADAGNVVPVSGIDSADPDYALYGTDASKVYPTEPIGISPEMFDYIVYKTPTNYLLYGEQCLEELEELRTSAVE